MKKPSFSVTPRDNLYISWRADDGSRIGIELNGDEVVIVVLGVPGPSREQYSESTDIRKTIRDLKALDETRN